ncbi:MAG: hypothetical protein RL027_618 [Pseudomonadota bacterium]|jgi:hypothetical protein
MEKIKYYLKEIKNNAKVFYDEEAYEKESKKESEYYVLLALAPLVGVTIMVITPLTIISYNILNGEPLLYVCCLFWALVLLWILAILFRDL